MNPDLQEPLLNRDPLEKVFNVKKMMNYKDSKYVKSQLIAYHYEYIMIVYSAI
jgi:hypothetical protein